MVLSVGASDLHVHATQCSCLCVACLHIKAEEKDRMCVYVCVSQALMELTQMLLH